MDELELIHELQRFAARFDDRVTQATESLERSPEVRVRDEALRKNLTYTATALEIASGALPEINLLDMIVFVRLSRTVLDRYWIPMMFGAAGRELSEVFASSEVELSSIADRALSAPRRERVTALIDAWLADNPSQVRVESVRLADFASDAASAAADRMLEAKGILSSVKTATQAANQAMLMSERGLFLLHRMPSVWRLQARLSAREILGDSAFSVKQSVRATIAKIAHRARAAVTNIAAWFALEPRRVRGTLRPRTSDGS
jgi:hypothetical protein